MIPVPTRAGGERDVDEVLLREVREADLPILFEHQQDPEAIQMASLKGRDRETFTAHWAKILIDETVTVHTILFNGEVAGTITSFDREGMREVGYLIGKQYWGKGVATMALKEFLRRASVRPLHAVVAKHNPASIRVLEKNGFAITGYRTAPADDRWEEAIEEVLMKLEAP
jgi:RimJ/RimL family protein N-acetyltransferase